MYKDVDLDANTGYPLFAELYTNTTGMDETIVDGSLTHPAAGSYARVEVSAGDWTVVGDTAVLAVTTDFPVATADYTGGDVIGVSIGTDGTTKRTYFFDPNTIPVDVNINDQYKVNMT